MLSGVEVMPAAASVDPTKWEHAWKSKFDHAEEIVQPGYHRVYLKDPKTWVELTSTDRVSFYRYRFTDDMETQLLTNLGGYIGESTMANAEVEEDRRFVFRRVPQFREKILGRTKRREDFFVVQFDKPAAHLDGWVGKKQFKDIKEFKGDSLGVSAKYKVKAGDVVQMKIGISYTSIENAKKNLTAELPGWDFDAVRNESKQIWNDWLGKIKVEGGRTDQRIKFYTDILARASWAT